MALVFKDRVKETTTTTGTGTLTLSGASDGFQAFTAIGNANTTYYTLVSGANWEVGIGTYTLSGTTLSRDTVLSSSKSGSKISASGTSDVFCTYAAERVVIADASDVVRINNPLAFNGIYLNSNVVATSVTFEDTYNGMSAGPVTVNSGVTVTVPSGSNWVIV